MIILLCMKSFTPFFLLYYAEFNTGLVTLNNHQLPQPCVRNVFSHEIGHNWGSEHDDQDSYDCTNHLMAPEKLYVQPEGTHVVKRYLMLSVPPTYCLSNP